MPVTAELAQASPAIVVHTAVAGAALLLGPLALGLPKGSRWHRAAGYAWITMMVAAALSSVFIRDFRLPNLWGYTPIHLLSLATFVGLGVGLWSIAHRQMHRHRRAMRITYGALLVAGLFTLLPSRMLGHLLWHHALGWT